jgi:ParB family chromosome partitioning protein
MGPKDDEELQRQIEANEGIFEPLLVEPHPDLPQKFRIIDGDRRWTNSYALVNQNKDQFRRIPVEVTDRTLSDDERLRAWIYIHRQRKEWDAKEKEMVAYRLVELVGRASAANILGITVRELDKLVSIFELSERFHNLRDPSAAITWARELAGVSKKLLTPSIVDAIVKKVGEKRITNSKDLRKLRAVLRDPVARAHFLTHEGDIASALIHVAPEKPSRNGGLVGELEELIDVIQRRPWTELVELGRDQRLMRRLDEAEAMLKALRRTLSAPADEERGRSSHRSDLKV